MFWADGSITSAEARKQASASEIVARFQDERLLLTKLAFLITGNRATAEQAVVNACQITLHRHSPFRDWLLESPRLPPSPVPSRDVSRRFVLGKRHTKISSARMKSIYRMMMLRSMQLGSSSCSTSSPRKASLAGRATRGNQSGRRRFAGPGAGRVSAFHF
jgi:hypothetical protein